MPVTKGSDALFWHVLCYTHTQAHAYKMKIFFLKAVRLEILNSYVVASSKWLLTVPWAVPDQGCGFAFIDGLLNLGLGSR